MNIEEQEFDGSICQAVKLEFMMSQLEQQLYRLKMITIALCG
jgi:hypothetical protein